MYVDDILFCSRTEDDIFVLDKSLWSEGVKLEEEHDAADFLCANLECNTSKGQIEITQQGLINFYIPWNWIFWLKTIDIIKLKESLW